MRGWVCDCGSDPTLRSILTNQRIAMFYNGQRSCLKLKKKNTRLTYMRFFAKLSKLFEKQYVFRPEGF